MQLQSETCAIRYRLLLDGALIAEDVGEGAWNRIAKKCEPGMQVMSIRTTVTTETADVTEHALSLKQQQEYDESECRAKVVERRLEWNE